MLEDRMTARLKRFFGQLRNGFGGRHVGSRLGYPAGIPQCASHVFLWPELNGLLAVVTFSLRNRRAGRILVGGIIRFSALHDVAGWWRDATNASFDGRLKT